MRGEGGEDAIKAEGVCRLVLTGVHMCASFEEEILHLCIGGWVTHQLGWGRSGKVRENCKCWAPRWAT